MVLLLCMQTPNLEQRCYGGIYVAWMAGWAFANVGRHGCAFGMRICGDEHGSLHSLAEHEWRYARKGLASCVYSCECFETGVQGSRLLYPAIGSLVVTYC